MIKQTKEIESTEILSQIAGNLDANLKILSETLKVDIQISGVGFCIGGEEKEVDVCLRTLSAMEEAVKEGVHLKAFQVRQMIALVKQGREHDAVSMTEIIIYTDKGKAVRCKSLGQYDYVQAVKNNTITIAIGPAGTGKTYLAVAVAAAMMKAKERDKIILTRPAVEAGEKLGFLPGDLQDKVDPYLRPVYDALAEMFGQENYTNLMEKGVIEVAPLAYMRGRTLSNAFIILDEAQNATKEQIKMFLTRLGENSKMVVTGDITQTDLPQSSRSGLSHAADVLREVDDIAVVTLSGSDVVRHPLVEKIISAYEKESLDERGR